MLICSWPSVFLLGGSRFEPYHIKNISADHELREEIGARVALSLGELLRESLVEEMRGWIEISSVEVRWERGEELTCAICGEGDWSRKVLWTAIGDKDEMEWSLDEIVNMNIDFIIQSNDWSIEIDYCLWKLALTV